MGQYSNLIFIVAIVAVFYFMLIRPQQQRAKQQRDMLGNLKAGDEIVTIGGIFATVVAVGDRVRVKVADGSELELAKQAIGSVVSVADDSDDLTKPDDADATDEAIESDAEGSEV